MANNGMYTTDPNLGTVETVSKEEQVSSIKETINDAFEQIDSEGVVYETETILLEKQVANTNFVNISTFSLESEYNFYTDFFESGMAVPAIREKIIPNFYVLADEKHKEIPLHRYINTLNEQVDIDGLGTNNEIEYYDQYSRIASSAVFSNTRGFSTNMSAGSAEDILAREALTNLETQYFQDIILSDKYVLRLKEINANRNLLPYSINIKFTPISFSPLSRIISSIGLFPGFLFYLKNLNSLMTNEKVTFFVDQTERIGEEYRIIGKKGVEDVATYTFDNYTELLNDLKNYILQEDFMASFYLGLADENINLRKQILADREVALINLQQSTIAKKFRSLLIFRTFAKRFEEYIENNSPSIESILGLLETKEKGSKNKNLISTEVLAYELVKTSLDNNNPVNQKIQSIFIPHMELDEAVEYVDSQVKYGKQYKYDLYSYCLAFKPSLNRKVLDYLTADTFEQILGLAARADSTSTEILSRYLQKLRSGEKISSDILIPVIKILLGYLEKMGLKPINYSISIFKRLVVSDRTAVFDNPPPPPEIEIDGMIGIDNKLFIRLDSSISEFKAVPVLIQPEDEEKFNNNVLRQQLNDLQSEMMFDGDDRIERFQIFKLDYHPKSYVDFKDSFTDVLTTYEVESKTNNYEICDILKRNHASFVDTIQPNKKYYYIFRSMDIHGNISNPSPLYEVETVNAEGTIFTLVRIVDFLKVDDKQPTKIAKRFIYIAPNAIQSLINERATGYFEENGEVKETADSVTANIVLGLTDEKIWDKRYRLKIRSKATGKIVEIDFKFAHKFMTKNAICQ